MSAIQRASIIDSFYSNHRVADTHGDKSESPATRNDIFV
jgi:hypothetical protein